MSRKGYQVTGIYLLNYEGNYHVADCKGRMYLCDCCKGWNILYKMGCGFGYRATVHKPIRNDIDMLEARLQAY